MLGSCLQPYHSISNSVRVLGAPLGWIPIWACLWTSFPSVSSPVSLLQCFLTGTIVLSKHSDTLYSSTVFLYTILCSVVTVQIPWNFLVRTLYLGTICFQAMATDNSGFRINHVFFSFEVTVVSLDDIRLWLKAFYHLTYRSHTR